MTSDSTSRAPLRGLKLLAAVVILLAVGCSSDSPLPADLELSAVQVEPSPTPPPPAIITMAATQAGESQVPQPIDPGAGQTGTQPAIVETATATATAPATAESLPSPKPAATFTPPPSPVPAAAEHFWLARPVPQGGTVWTDKAYPYGNTKGGTLRPHHGVEFNVPAGTAVLAAAAGTVRVAGSDSGEEIGAFRDFYGQVVVIEHDFTSGGQAVFTLYGHLSEVLVAPGDNVAAQSPIALSGATGVADGPHLHFEVRVGQNRYESTRNPLLWLYPFPDRGVVAGRVRWPDGAAVAEAPVVLRRIDAASAYAATTTYASSGVNSDELWDENFALDDVVAGYYELTVGTGDQKSVTELWVYPRQTTFVEVTLGG